MKVFALPTPLFILATLVTTTHSMDPSDPDNQKKPILSHNVTKLFDPTTRPFDWSPEAWQNLQDQQHDQSSSQQAEIERLNNELSAKQSEIERLAKYLKDPENIEREKMNLAAKAKAEAEAAKIAEAARHNNAVWLNPDNYYSQWEMTNFFER